MILTPVHLMRSAMQALQINPADDVATMIDGVAAGDAVAIGARTVIARDANGAMMPSGAYRCVRCKLEFTSIDQWRSAAGSAYSVSSWTQEPSAA